jgi:asparagine synthase (glutamine-hydrolysing)
MCGIAGIVTTEDGELGKPLKGMLAALEHRGPDGAGYVLGRTCKRSESLDDLEFRKEKTNVALGHVRLKITGGPTGVQPFRSNDGRISVLHNGEIYNYEELHDELEDTSGLDTGSDSEVLTRMIEEEYKGDLPTAVEKVLGRLDGVYALAVSDRHQTVLARDKIGVRPLYYTLKHDRVAFASERRPLSMMGCEPADASRLEPGKMLITDGSAHRLRPFFDPESLRSGTAIADLDEAIGVYGGALEEAVRKRVHNHDHVGVIFSGGIDSFMIAYLIDKVGVPFTCYVAGREGSPDTEWAADLAKRFGWDLKVHTLTKEKIETLIPEIIGVIEDHSLIQVEVALPIFASVRMAQDAGERVILTGQGADELFGGYSWYSTIVEQEGYDTFLRRSWEDTLLLYKECLEREDKISMAHSVELRVPFLDPAVVETAFRIAPELKIQPKGDTMGKRVHRQYASSIGIPDDTAWRTKEAAQHGANVHTAIEELALDAGVTAERLTKVGYDPEQTVKEQLGSCSRYGYRYGQEEMWRAAPHVQFYLDSHAARLEMLPPKAHDHWHGVHQQLAAEQTVAA